MKSIEYKVTGSFITEEGDEYKVNSPIFSGEKTPKELREEARKYFKMWTDYLQEAEDFQPSFVESRIIDGEELPIKYGIGLYALIDNEEYLIDFFGSFYGFTYDSLALGLSQEYEHYLEYNWEMPDIFKTTYCDMGEFTEGYEDDAITEIKHFYTSVDLKGKELPYWWLSKGEKIEWLAKLLNEEEEESDEKEMDLFTLGENHFREFKPSLLFNFKTNKPSISVKYINAKAICAFLNSLGGSLYIGISDKEGVQGLGNSDFLLAEGKDPMDFVRLEFDQMLRYFFKPVVNTFITADFEEIEGKLVFVVKVKASNQPIFLLNKYNDEIRKEFYIRTSASSMPITDIEEVVDYCFSHWS